MAVRATNASSRMEKGLTTWVFCYYKICYFECSTANTEEFLTYSMIFQLQSLLNGGALNLASLKCAVFL